ncbi:MAG: M15 family metallopeptidase, partial [Clostridia bacterium]|nr:M15 family metallopeptidase [Clostridia bacterium]
INAENPIPSTWEVGSLAEVKGGQKVARRILPALKEMFNAARKEGVNPIVNSGYRTRSKQEKLLQEKYKEYIKDGLSETEAQEKALEWVAYPGTSEHEAGLGVDIGAAKGSKDKVYEWMAENSWKYGFILRYPEDKTQITGIINEPWHFRYVGKLAAAEMHQTGQCLEEYLESKGLMPDGNVEGALPAVTGNLLDAPEENANGLDPLISEN